jgi:hypothetical protein
LRSWFYTISSIFGRHQSGAAMTKDAKLGLVLGIGLVIVICVVFFRKDVASAKGAETAAAAVKPKGPLTLPPLPAAPLLSEIRD